MQKPSTWSSLLQFIFSLLGSLLLWSAALLLAGLGLAGSLDPALGTGSSLALFSMAASLAFIGVLLLPSAVFALDRLMDGPPRQAELLAWLRRLGLSSIILLPLILLGGEWAGRNGGNWLLPLLQILAVALPVSWFFMLASRGLKLGSAQRFWGVFATGVFLGPVLALLLELVALIVILALGYLALASQPELLEEITSLLQRLTISPPSPALLQRMLGPYLLNPAAAGAILAYVAGLVPLLEEAVKPVGLWLIAGKKLTPAQGFVGGMLSGAGFAIFESLLLATGGEGWTAMLAARVAPGLMHIATTGTIGYALAASWQGRKYARLGLAYLAVVAVHGLWNGMGVLSAGYELLAAGPDDPNPWLQVGRFAPYILMGVALLMALWLYGFSRMLRRREQETARLAAMTPVMITGEILPAAATQKTEPERDA